MSLSSEHAANDADLVSAVLAFDPRIDIDDLATQTGLTPARVEDALQVLAFTGQVGSDEYTVKLDDDTYAFASTCCPRGRFGIACGKP